MVDAVHEWNVCSSGGQVLVGGRSKQGPPGLVSDSLQLRLTLRARRCQLIDSVLQLRRARVSLFCPVVGICFSVSIEGESYLITSGKWVVLQTEHDYASMGKLGKNVDVRLYVLSHT